MYVSIDPGLTTGWALWAPGLVACGLGDPRSSKLHMASNLTGLWVESQVIYPRSKVPPNDIVKLAHGAGRWCGIYEVLGVPWHLVEPAEWKGQVPKPVHHARIWAKLSPEEQDVVGRCLKGVPAGQRHNALDAVGLGLWVRER